MLQLTTCQGDYRRTATLAAGTVRDNGIPLTQISKEHGSESGECGLDIWFLVFCEP